MEPVPLNAQPQKRSYIYLLILGIAMVVLFLDIYTKQLAEKHFGLEGASREIFSWFSFTLAYNYSAAFGLFGSFPESFRRVFLLILPVLVLLLLWHGYVKKFHPKERLGPTALGFVLGGAIANLWDRLPDGRVTDFIDWHYGTAGKCMPLFYRFTATRCHWPIFNLADCAITLAMVLLVIHSFQKDTQPKGLS